MSLSSIPPPPKNVYNVPMALDVSLERTRGLELETASRRNGGMVQDAMGFTIGPMPVRKFLNTFMPLPDPNDTRAMLSSRNAFQFIPSCVDSPTEIHEPLLSALNKRTKYKSRSPGFVFRATSSHSAPPPKLAFLKPDICCYSKSNLSTVERSEPSSRAELGYADLFIDVKSDPRHDYFVDPPEGVLPRDHEFFAPRNQEHYTRRRDRAYGQHIGYVTEIFARQYRVCVYSISLSGSHARFLRWDRAGCIVSTSFDLRQEPELMCDFLWAFSHVNELARGHDVTVFPAFPDEEKLLEETLREHIRFQLEIEGGELERALSEHYVPGHAVLMNVVDHGYPADEQHIQQFIVSRPVVSPLRPNGRATRGFWAVHRNTRTIGFLKDTWRFGREYEGLTIWELNAKGVRNVPSLVTHGDVPGWIPQDEYYFTEDELQCSVTDQFCTEDWVTKVCGRHAFVAKHSHYRIVLGTVGYGLKHLKGTKELLHSTYDVFHAVRDAHSLASRLHRDISVGNIILVREPKQETRRGYLIDWDASSLIDETGDSIWTGRACTWLFMSKDMLGPHGITKEQTLQDDMESLLYVVLYCGYLWLPHNLPKKRLAGTIMNLFEARTYDVGQKEYLGGQGKIGEAVYRLYTSEVEFNAAFQEWIGTVLDYCFPPTGEMREIFRANGQWSDPEHLDRFWGEFLQTHDLIVDDRYVHDHPHATDRYEGDASGTSEALSLGRRSSCAEEDSARVKKKARVDRVVAKSLRMIRRSARIQEQGMKT